jgi:MATE family multidrug resistance protein
VEAMAVDTPLLTNNDSNLEDEKQLGFVKKFGNESKTLWKLAGPAIFTAICQYSLGALTQTFAGQVGELELAAVSVENSVIAGLAFGVMVKISKYLFSLVFSYQIIIFLLVYYVTLLLHVYICRILYMYVTI